MTEATAAIGDCKECGTPLARKGAGPKPTYCSGKCRAKAGGRRAKADGRTKQWGESRKAKLQARREAEARPCPHCGDLMTHSRRVQCGKLDCERQHTNERMKQWQRDHKAKTGQRYGAKYRYEQTCIQCGISWRAASGTAKYCSNTCQAEREHGGERIPKKGRKGYLKRRRLLKRIAKAAEGTRGTLPFVSGPCASCGDQVTTRRSDVRWCSDKCKLRQKAVRRRAAKRGAFIEDVSPLYVFERDRWRCQLCRKGVKKDRVAPHPLAPVLDHIIPLAKGGMHEAANLQCAHFICNSTKRDVGGGEQLMLIG